MSQVQSVAARMPGRDARPGLDRVPQYCSADAETFQNINGLLYFTGNFDDENVVRSSKTQIQHQQRPHFLVPRPLLAQGETNWQIHGASALTLLNTEQLARLNLELPPYSASEASATYAQLDFHPNHQIQSSQRYLENLSSPVSTSSPSSIISQDCFQSLTRQDLQHLQSIQGPSFGGISQSIPPSPPITHGELPPGAMGDQRLPGTPQSLDEYNEMLQNNNGVPYDDHLNDGHYPNSGPVTAYGSPASNHWAPNQYDDGQYQQQGWHGGPNPRYAPPYPGQYGYPPGFVDRIPLSPAPSDLSSQMRPPPGGRTRAVAEGPRPRSTPARATKKKNKGDRSKDPHVPQALSLLTKDIDAPIRDMEAWVNRSDEERYKESEKKGKIARPMNCFMLYRSAYAERTKIWCTQNNHQVVSCATGKSWAMEPDEIRDHYIELARIERENHQKAHPNYKFSPSKGGKGKRKGNEYSDEEDESIFGATSDAEWTPAGGRGGRGRRGQRYQDPPQQFVPDIYQYQQQQQQMQNPQYYAQQNRPLPAPIDDFGYSTQAPYYPQQARPPTAYTHVSGAGQQHAPSGLPGANHDELYTDMDLEKLLAGSDNNQIVDPNLMGGEESYGNGVFSQEGFNELDGDILRQSEAPQPKEEADGAWDAEQAADDDFKNWLENNNTK